MLGLSRFLRAVVPTCAFLAAGASVMPASYAALLKSPLSGAAITPFPHLQTSFHRGEEFMHVGVPTLRTKASQKTQKEFGRILRTIPAYSKALCAPGDPIEISLTVEEGGVVETTEGGATGVGNTTVDLTVTRSGDTTGTTTVYYETYDLNDYFGQDPGYATKGQDFTEITFPDGAVTFRPGETSKVISLPIINDSIYEDSSPYRGEVFEMDLVGAEDSSGADVYAGDSIYTLVGIIDDDSEISFNPSSVSVAEDAGTATLTAVRIGSTLRNAELTATYSTADVTATAGQDYTPVTNKTITIPAGSNSATISFDILEDIVDEANESFSVNLINSASRTTRTGTVNIADNDDIGFQIQGRPFSVAEGVGKAKITVARSGASDTEATVQYRTIDGTAKAGSDYTTTEGTLTFAAGTSSQTIEVPITQDALDEDTEVFVVELFNSSLASSPAITAPSNVSIRDDDDAPSLTFDDAPPVNEGNAGENPVQNFTLTLSAASGRDVTIEYTTSDGSATVADKDYTPVTRKSFTIKAGNKTALLPVTLIGDNKFEDNEAYLVTLSDSSDRAKPTNATILTPKKIGQIVNDDPRPVSTFNFSSVTVSTSENNPNVTLTVRRTDNTTTAASIKVTTANGTATSGTDYGSVATTLQFPANAQNQPQSATVTIPILDDAIDEATETFTATLSAPTPTGSNSSDRSISQLGTDTVATVSIADNDAVPTLSIGDVSVVEGDSGTTELVFTATLDTESGQTISVDYATADGTATVANNDYAANSGTLTFAPGEVSKTITVVINSDTTTEKAETFSLNLSSPVNVKPDRTTITGTITNDDIPLVMSDLAFSSSSLKPTVSETAGRVILTVTRTQGSDRTATVKYATSNGTAKSGSDYTTTSGTLTFAINQKSATIIVPVLDDTLKEDAETFNVTLSSPSSNATLPTEKTAVVTIKDNEGTPSLSITNAQVNEGNSGKATLTFTVSLQPQSQSKVTVVAATAAGGTASSASGKGQDFETKTATLTFNPGESTKTFTVSVVSDAIVEPDETVAVALSAASGAPIKQAKATGTIINDDQPGGGGTISFLTSSYSIDEGAGVATITIARSGNVDMLNQQSASVRVISGKGTATASKDYKPINTVITFAPGETVKSFTISIVNDTLFEQEESVPLTLSAPSDNAILGATTEATLFISDDDAQTNPRANSAKGS